MSRRFKVLCEACGVDINARVSNTQTHCDKPECIQAYCHRVVMENGHYVDSHFIYMDGKRSGHYQPYVWLRLNGKSVPRRAIDILFEEEYGQDHRGHPFINMCGVENCITPAHNDIADVGSKNTRVQLPAEELVKLIDQRQVFFGESNERLGRAITKARKTGSISLAFADEICCDLLKMHPYQVFGWEFYTAGTKDAA